MLLSLLEVLFLAALVAGVAFIFWPAALILGGVLGALACEWMSYQRRLARAAAQTGGSK